MTRITRSLFSQYFDCTTFDWESKTVLQCHSIYSQSEEAKRWTLRSDFSSVRSFSNAVNSCILQFLTMYICPGELRYISMEIMLIILRTCLVIKCFVRWILYSPSDTYESMHIKIGRDFSNLYKNWDFSIDFSNCFTAVEIYLTCLTQCIFILCITTKLQ